MYRAGKEKHKRQEGGYWVDKYKIMLVDDEPDILDLLEKALNIKYLVWLSVVTIMLQSRLARRK